MTEEEFKSLIKTIAVFVAIGIMIVIATYVYQFQNNSLGGTASFGAFGDYIGGLLNPILGFATVMLLIFSIRIQMKELRDSTAALEASQAAHEKLAENSKKELAIIQQGHLDQQEALKKESRRNQLTENAERIIKTFDELMNTPYMNAKHKQYSFHEILHSLTEPDDFIFKNTVTKIDSLMNSKQTLRTDQVKRMHIEDIKKNMNQLLLVFTELKPLLEIPYLRKIWADRLITRLHNCYALKIISEEKLQTTLGFLQEK